MYICKEDLRGLLNWLPVSTVNGQQPLLHPHVRVRFSSALNIVYRQVV